MDFVRVHDDTTIANNSSDGYNSDSKTLNSGINTTAELFVQTKACQSNSNLNDAHICVSRQCLKQDVQDHTSPQTFSQALVFSSCRTLKPSCFLDMPLEIRLKIYELVVGGSQRVRIRSNTHHIPSAIIPCSDHSSARCLPATWDSWCQATHCQGTAIFSHRLCPSYDPYRPKTEFITVSCDLQTGKQQVDSNHGAPDHQSALCLYGNACAGCMQDLRLLRTCRQIYIEASSVLYNSSTFVFLGFATFAAYLGLCAPEQVYMSRYTDPNRLRSFQAMTKVEIHDQAVESSRDFLLTSRIIRAGLGCLTSLVNLELKLIFSLHLRKLPAFPNPNELPRWEIDDCLFSKPSSLRKLVVNVQNYKRIRPDHLVRYRQIMASGGRMLTINEEMLVLAEETMTRILKQEGFSDKPERLLSDDRIAAWNATDDETEGL